MMSFSRRHFMGAEGRTADSAMDEVADAQASLDPTRSECVRPTILDHFHRWMRAKDMVDRFMELDGLIRACVPFVSDPRTARDVSAALEAPLLRADILTKNTNLFLSGVPIGILELNEAWVRYPQMCDIWAIVQRDLVRSGLLPWALQYPERALEGRMLGRLMDELDSEINALPMAELPRPSLIAEEHIPVPTAIAPSPMPPQIRDEDSPAAGLKGPPIGPRPEGQDHASFMAEQMAALHQGIHHMDDWQPETLPIPPGEIDAAAESVGRVLKERPRKVKR
jgi:hypothetical protein